METLNLEQIFGIGAVQTGTTLIIQKSSLVGLTSAALNRAESLLAAILITALENFQGIITDENNQPITNENNQPITFDNSEAFDNLKIIRWTPFQNTRNGIFFLNHQLIVFLRV